MLTNELAFHILALFCVPSLCLDADISAFVNNQMESAMAVLYHIYDTLILYCFYDYVGALCVGGQKRV